MSTFDFQYCQKIVIFSEDFEKVLLCTKKGTTTDENETSFIGGKMETTDDDILKGIAREKTEEIGSNCRIQVFTDWNMQTYLKREDDENCTIMPHYFAIFIDGEIVPNKNYIEYTWVPFEKLQNHEYEVAKKLYENRGFIMRGKGIIA